MQQLEDIYPEDKIERYELLVQQMKTMLEGETDVIANLSNASALLNVALRGINWVGFYLMKQNKLILGPFQGKLACIHIPIGRGVCGTAAETGLLQLVSDVHEFPGHIACDSASNSEIVVPMKLNHKILGVLDIDSPNLNHFDEVDARYLQLVVELLIQASDWQHCGAYDFSSDENV